MFQRGKCIKFFCKLPFNKEKQKNTKKKWFWRALASILRVFAVLFPHKSDEKEQLMDYLDIKLSHGLRMTLHKITFTYKKIVYVLQSTAVSMATTIFCLQIFRSNRILKNPLCTRWFISSYFYDHLSRQTEPKCRRLLSW